MVVGGGEEVPVQVGVSAQTVALLLVPAQPQVGVALSRGIGLAGMLGVVEYEHVAGGRLGGDDARVLGHEAGPVDLSLVVDLDLDFNLA